VTDAPRPEHRENRTRPGFRGPEEVYPDPPRSWTRAGILLVGWVAAWGAVFLFGLGLQAVAQAQADEKLPLGGQAVSRQFFYEIFLDRDLDAAGQFLCDSYSGLPIDGLSKKYLDWEAANGRTNVDISLNQVTDREFEISVDYGPSSAVVIERFTTITQPSEDDDCITDLYVRADDPVEPSPEETPDEPEISGRDAIDGYFDAIFRNQDAAAAEQYQCGEYSGVPISELLDIYTAHQGTGDVEYSLNVTATSSEEGKSDQYSIVVTLDRDEYSFSVLIDATTPQRCVASVTET